MGSDQSTKLARRPKFFIDLRKWGMSIQIQRMSFEERGRRFSEFVDAVAERDEKAVKEALRGWLNGIVTKIYWHEGRTREYIPADVRQSVLAKYGAVCQVCGSTQWIEIDHIRPYSRGGSNRASNLQPLCKPCNIRKGAKMPRRARRAV